MSKYVLMPLMLLFIVGVGCIGQQPEAPAGEQPPAGEEQINVPEKEIVTEVAKIELIDYPDEINAGESALFKWNVGGLQGTVPHTAIHFGKESTPIVDENTAPASTNYAFFTEDYASGSFNVPGEFSAAVQIDEPGTYYARAHVIADGKNLWSDEISFTVKGELGQPVREFTIKVSDAGFEPNEIEVDKGDLVKIHFEVASEGVQENGVRIVSPGWNEAPALMPGDTQDVEFIAADSFDYRVFWLAGNLLKGTGSVKVNK